MRLHVLPVLGHLAMQVITPSHIRSWQRTLTMSRAYQRTIFANVSQIFTAAVADDVIGKNPCSNRTVRKPTADPRRVLPWTPEQVAAVHTALPPRYTVLVPLAAGTGLRQGEIFALSPDDVDMRRGIVTVRRQIKLTPGNQPHFALPKSRKIRTVPVPDSVAEHLRAHLERYPARPVTLPADGPDSAPITVALLLTTRESRAVNRHYFNAKIWKPALVAAGIPPVRENGCHALRHYYASVLLDGGESIKTVSERLGHADPGFTLRTYTHLLPQSETRTRAIIDGAMQALPATPRPRGGRVDHDSVTVFRAHGPVRARRAPGHFGPQR